jgi:membrane protein DedA with SNARE-associated domain
VLASITSTLVDRCTEAIGDHGWYAVFFLMLLESACIPVPSEAIMLFAGFLVSQHQMGFAEAVLAGTAGNLVGSQIAWAVGAYGGLPFIHRYGRYVHVTERRLALAHRWFERYGGRVVFFSRMLPIIRTFISLPAGIARMPFWRFSLYTFLGALPWVAALCAVGVAVGPHWKQWEDRLKFLDYIVAALIVAAAVWLYLRWRRTRASAAAG